jgi:hypothetical protein
MEMKDAASVATVMDEQPVETWNREKVLNWIRGREPELLKQSYPGRGLTALHCGWGDWV